MRTSLLQALRAGIWLDASGATVVTLTDGAEPEVDRIDSEVDSRFRVSGGRKSGMQTQDVSDEKRAQRRRRQQLDRYYEQVAASVDGVEDLLILGPGQAKQRLERLLRERRRGPKRIRVQSTDRMTTRQIVAAVRRHFATE